MHQESIDSSEDILNKYNYEEYEIDYDSLDEESLNFWFDKNIEDYVEIIFMKYFTKVRNRFKTLDYWSVNHYYSKAFHFVKFGVPV